MFNINAKGDALHVAIIRTTSIGDCVLATACIQVLLKLEQPLKIFWIAKEPSATLLKEAYPELEVIPLKKKDEKPRSAKSDRVSAVFGGPARKHALRDN